MVTTEIDEARFICLTLGSGEGLHVELRTIAERNRFDRICIVLPPIDSAAAGARLQAVRPVLAAPGGWGDFDSDLVDGRSIIALVGVGDRRLIVVSNGRDNAFGYAGLGQLVLAALGAGDVPVTPQQAAAATGVPTTGATATRGV